MGDHKIRPGTPVSVLTAFGDWRDAIATSALEPTHMGGKKVHNFPVIWIRLATQTNEEGPIPWPAESVRLARGGEP